MVINRSSPARCQRKQALNVSKTRKGREPEQVVYTRGNFFRVRTFKEARKLEPRYGKSITLLKRSFAPW